MPCSDRAWREFTDGVPDPTARPGGGVAALGFEYAPEAMPGPWAAGPATRRWRRIDIEAALYRLAAYAMLNLLDDAAMLAMMFC